MSLIEHKLPFSIKTAQKSGFFVCGTSGSGKTVLSYSLADKLMKAGVVVFVFDPSRAWMKESSVPYYITIDPENPAQFKMEKEKGLFRTKTHKVLDININPNISTIFDLTYLYVHERREIVDGIVGGIYRRQVRKSNPKPIFFLFEEAHMYFPQGCFRSITGKNSCKESLQVFTVGRNFKARCGIITQFPAMVDKLVIKLPDQKYFGKTDEKNDLSYIRSFIPDSQFYTLRKNPETGIVESVPTLSLFNVGEFFYDVGADTKRIKVPMFKSKSVPRKYIERDVTL